MTKDVSERPTAAQVLGKEWPENRGGVGDGGCLNDIDSLKDHPRIWFSEVARGDRKVPKTWGCGALRNGMFMALKWG